MKFNKIQFKFILPTLSINVSTTLIIVFIFIFYLFSILDLGLGVSMMSQTVTQYNMVSNIWSHVTQLHVTEVLEE